MREITVPDSHDAQWRRAGKVFGDIVAQSHSVAAAEICMDLREVKDRSLSNEILDAGRARPFIPRIFPMMGVSSAAVPRALTNEANRLRFA